LHYQEVPRDNMVGRLTALQRRLEADPIPEIFDGRLQELGAHGRGDTIEVEHFIDYALAAAIEKTTPLPAARLWRWTVNARDHTWSQLGDQASKALAAWLDATDGHEAAFFDAILAEDEPEKQPGNVINDYITTTRRYTSPAVIKHLLLKVDGADEPGVRRRFLAIAVEMAHATKDNVYWQTYDRVAREAGADDLIYRLTTDTIEAWRLEQQARAEERRGRA